MVTKPTGRLRGRPKSTNTQKTVKRTRGQPQKPISSDPDRYAISTVLAFHSIAKQENGHSLLKICSIIATFHYCRMMPTYENITAAISDHPVQFVNRPGLKRLGHIDAENPEHWEQRNHINPYASKLKRKVYLAFQKQKPEDLKWLEAMTVAIIVCIKANPFMIDTAAQLAASVSESDYFSNRLLPYYLRRKNQIELGDQAPALSPELIAITFPTTG